ncbi:MAG: winged helix-turn-helix domain-containing protein, partial [Eubacteriales bacterium]
GSVHIIFNNEGETDRGETVEFTCASPFTAAAAQEPLAVNLGRREILIDGKPLHLFGKDLDLLLLLYRNRNNAVSYNEIKAVVWPERLHNGADNIPDVGSDEITALVYRLRKRLGRYGQCVISVPRFGYMLDM